MRNGTLRTLAALCGLSFVVSGLLAFTPLYTHEEESVFRDRDGRPLPLRISRLTGERWHRVADSLWVPVGLTCGTCAVDAGYFTIDENGNFIPRKPFSD